MATKKSTVTEPEVEQSTSSGETSLATQEAPGAIQTSSTFADLAADAEKFDAGFTAQDLSQPFLQVLQSNSPYVTEGNPKYIEGSRPGMIINTLTKEIYATVKAQGKPAKQPLFMAIVNHDKTVIEWKTRESGGGFVKDHGLAQGMALLQKASKNEKGQFIRAGVPEHQLVETAQYHVLYATALEGDVDIQGALAPLTSTQLKKSRQLNTTLSGIKITRNGRKFNPPPFYTIFRVETVYESNDKGNWYGWEFTPEKNVEELGAIGEEFYSQARKMREAISAGLISNDASYRAADAAEAADGAGNEPVPF